MSDDEKIPRPLPIGVDDYVKLVENNYWSADKTLMIKEILDSRPEVLLFCRPRRFGKTLNMSMLRCFFERPVGGGSTAYLFEGKAIWAAGERYRAEQGRYPVVWLTLKDLHYATFAEARRAYADAIAVECARHPELAESQNCSETDRQTYARLIARKPEGVDLERSLSLLIRMLSAHWGQKVVLIIDEYDALIQEGYARGYYDEAVTFVRNLFGPALKTNPDLQFAFLTGILRVAKESIFSGLNNVEVDTVLERTYASFFGLTESEAASLLAERGRADKLPLLLEWYDGYRFGETNVLNPWSTLNFVRHGCQPLAYWVDTSGNAIIGEVMEGATPELRDSLEGLLQGSTIQTSVNTSIIYPEIKSRPESVWSFLLVTGYLTARSARSVSGRYRCELAIPNAEVRVVFQDEVIDRFFGGGRSRSCADDFADALLSLDAPGMECALRNFLLASVSYFDTPSESFFHGLLLGLCAVAGGEYRITSNREAGEGRFDIQMEPKRAGLPGMLVEVKLADSGESLEDAAARALEQIQGKCYSADLRSRGVERIACFGAAFCGKDSRVDMSVEV